MKKISILFISILLSLSIFNVVLAEDHCIFKPGADGKLYWYENGKKQGTYNDKGCVMGDGTCRGREIYDPKTKAWYWLDSVYGGAKAEGKEVWIPYIYQDEDKWDDSTIRNIADESNIYTESDIRANMGDQVYNAMKNKLGKWVRYDSTGKMVKGWYTVYSTEDKIAYSDQIANTYYYDYRTGLMAKGWTNINGRNYFFNETTGALEGFYDPENSENHTGREVIKKGYKKADEYAYDLEYEEITNVNINQLNDATISLLKNGIEPSIYTCYYDNEGYQVDDYGTYIKDSLLYEPSTNRYYHEFDYDGNIVRFYYDTNFNNVEDYYYSTEDGENRFVYNYNSHYKIDTTDIYENGVLTGRDLNKYEYDSNGRMITQRCYENDYNHPNGYVVYRYNSEGLIQYIINVNNDGTVTCIYETIYSK